MQMLISARMGGACEASHTVSAKNEAVGVDPEFFSNVRSPYKRDRRICVLQYAVDGKDPRTAPRPTVMQGQHIPPSTPDGLSQI